MTLRMLLALVAPNYDFDDEIDEQWLAAPLAVAEANSAYHDAVESVALECDAECAAIILNRYAIAARTRKA